MDFTDGIVLPAITIYSRRLHNFINCYSTKVADQTTMITSCTKVYPELYDSNSRQTIISFQISIIRM